MAKKVQYTTNQPSSTTDYLAADNTWKTIPSGTSGGIPHGSTSGTDTYTTTISGVTTLADGDAFLIRFTTGNTTTATLNINSLGAKTLYRNNDGQLIGGDIVDGAEMLCVYNSTSNSFQVIGTAPNTLLAYVTNAESTTITKGQPVYAFGGQGDRLKVKLAYNTSDATSAQTVGIVLSSSITANGKGLIIINGQLDGLSLFPTSTWADGDAVYLGATAGSVTKTKPSAPNHLVYLGFVTTANNGSAGRMYVRVQNGYELDELHDAQVGSYGTKDVLWRDTATNLWKNKDVFTLMGSASSSTNGYLTSTDWSTFNGKQSALGYTPEDVSNKKTAMSGNETSNIFYLSAKAIYDWATSAFQSVITGAATTITSANLTTYRALVSDGGGKVAVSGVTGTELGYLSGVTSNVQSQIDSKQGAGSGGSFVLITRAATGQTAGSTSYWWSGGAGGTTAESQLRTPFPDACTCSKLYARITNTQSATGSLVISLFKNGTVSALVLTIAANSAAGTYSNTTNSVTFAAGDGYAVEIKNNATATSAPISGLAFKITI